MIVVYRTDIPDHLRRALRAQWGQKGLATRKEIVGWIEAMVNATADDIVHEYETGKAAGEG